MSRLVPPNNFRHEVNDCGDEQPRERRELATAREMPAEPVVTEPALKDFERSSIIMLFDSVRELSDRLAQQEDQFLSKAYAHRLEEKLVDYLNRQMQRWALGPVRGASRHGQMEQERSDGEQEESDHTSRSPTREQAAALYSKLSGRIHRLEQAQATQQPDHPDELWRRLDELEQSHADNAALGSRVGRLEQVVAKAVAPVLANDVPKRRSGRIDRLEQAVAPVVVANDVPKRRRLEPSMDDFANQLDDPFIGQWCDKDSCGGFYAGCVIQITKDGWRPLDPKHSVQKQAAYSLERVPGDGERERELLETREDGTVRRFRATKGTNDVLFIELKGGSNEAPLRWILVRETRVHRSQRWGLQDVVASQEQKRGPLTHEGEPFLSLQIRAIVDSPRFETVVACVVFFDMLLIGLEVDRVLKGQEVAFKSLLQYGCLMFYIAEFWMRALAICGPEGAALLRREFAFLTFELVLIIIGAATIIFGGSFPRLVVFRVLRLGRLLQSIRFMRSVRPLWRLVQGLTKSAGQLFWTMVMILLLIYVFACIATEIIATDESLRTREDTRSIVEAHFPNMLVSMLTLWRFTTGEITDLFPLIDRDPWLVLLFGPGFFLITILLMNLVTASLVNDAIEQGKEDQAMRFQRLRRKLRELVPELQELFDRLDKDGNGQISMEDLAQVNHESMACCNEIQGVFTPENLNDSYECFDADNSGLVDKREFVEGCLAVLTKQDTPIDLMHTLQLVKKHGDLLRKIQRQLVFIENQVCLVP